jgi:murein DD-endopeptidase MepM/ murein hydrolase activator NlpD
MKQERKTKRLLALALLLVFVLGLLQVSQTGSKSVGEANSGFTLQDQDAASRLNLTYENWPLYEDPNYGFAVRYPPDWFSYPSNQSGDGSVATIANYPLSKVSMPSPADFVKVEIGVFLYDKSPIQSLEEWAKPVAWMLPSLVRQNELSINGICAIQQTYLCGETFNLITYIPRGTKVYFVSVTNPTSTLSTELLRILASFTFTAPYGKPQKVVDYLYPRDTFDIHPESVSLTAPSGFRLPFDGSYEISNGPREGVHQGRAEEAIDFVMATGTEVKATETGTVIFRGVQGCYGNIIGLQHDNGMLSWYAHLQEFVVSDNQPVSKGQLIARSGATGTGEDCPSTGAHLHFHVREGETPICILDLPGVWWNTSYNPDDDPPGDPDLYSGCASYPPSGSPPSECREGARTLSCDGGPPPPPCPPENCTPGNEVGRDFFVEVLERLADVPVSDFAVDALELWEPYENTLACWNPLATTWEMEGSCDYFCVNPPECTNYVQHYLSQDMGTQATANTLALSYYDAIRKMLRRESFDREQIRQALITWSGAGEYVSNLLDEWEALWNDQGGGSDLRQAGNLEISPSNPQVNQETTFSFEVHNYGDQSLTLQNIGPGGKGPPNGQGGDWNALTQNITVGGHQTVPVSASRIFGEGTWCVEKIVFQRQDGGWFDLPANGYQQAKCFEVGSVPPQPHPGEVPDNPGSGWAYKEPDTWQSGIWTYHDDATLHWDVPEANCDLGIYQYRAYFGPNSSGLGGDSDNLLDNEIVPSNEVTVGPIDGSGTYYLRLSIENDCCCENGEGSWDENRQCFRCRNTNWETVFIYRLDNLEPPNPDHATDLRGSQSGQWTYHDDTTFVWDIPSDPGGSGVKEYHVYFGMDPGGTGNNTVSIPQLAVGPMTEWGTYYLRINTEDNAGNRTGIWTVGEGVWDAIFTYRFDNGEPPNPVLATETHGVQSGEATDINDPTFTWVSLLIPVAVVSAATISTSGRIVRVPRIPLLATNNTLLECWVLLVSTT